MDEARQGSAQSYKAQATATSESTSRSSFSARVVPVLDGPQPHDGNLSYTTDLEAAGAPTATGRDSDGGVASGSGAGRLSLVASDPAGPPLTVLNPVTGSRSQCARQDVNTVTPLENSGTPPQRASAYTVTPTMSTITQAPPPCVGRGMGTSGLSTMTTRPRPAVRVSVNIPGMVSQPVSTTPSTTVTPVGLGLAHSTAMLTTPAFRPATLADPHDLPDVVPGIVRTRTQSNEHTPGSTKQPRMILTGTSTPTFRPALTRSTSDHGFSGTPTRHRPTNGDSESQQLPVRGTGHGSSGTSAGGSGRDSEEAGDLLLVRLGGGATGGGHRPRSALLLAAGTEPAGTTRVAPSKVDSDTVGTVTPRIRLCYPSRPLCFQHHCHHWLSLQSRRCRCRQSPWPSPPAAQAMPPPQ